MARTIYEIYEYRFKILRVPASMIVNLLSQNFGQFGSLVLTAFDGIPEPEKAVVVSIRPEFNPPYFDFLLYHPSFEKLREGEMPPILSEARHKMICVALEPVPAEDFEQVRLPESGLTAFILKHGTPIQEAAPDGVEQPGPQDKPGWHRPIVEESDRCGHVSEVAAGVGTWVKVKCDLGKEHHGLHWSRERNVAF